MVQQAKEREPAPMLGSRLSGVVGVVEMHSEILKLLYAPPSPVAHHPHPWPIGPASAPRPAFIYTYCTNSHNQHEL